MYWHTQTSTKSWVTLENASSPYPLSNLLWITRAHICASVSDHTFLAASLGLTDPCWRGCGNTGTLLHIWWSCPQMKPFWDLVHKYVRHLHLTHWILRQHNICCITRACPDHCTTDLVMYIVNAARLYIRLCGGPLKFHPFFNIYLGNNIKTSKPSYVIQ